VKIHIPQIFRHLTGGVETLNIEGQTVGECLNALQDKFPGIVSRLHDEQGQIYKYIDLYLNNRNIGYNLDLPVKSEDELFILVTIMGG
jgi:molybdopterin synthase sulfur carrier subunit